jgi:hypothetical protein
MIGGRTEGGAPPRAGQRPLHAIGYPSLAVRQVDVDELFDVLSSPSPSQ